MSLPLLGAGKGTDASWSPASSITPWFWIDASDLSSLYQDTARIVPVAANNDPVGSWGDKSGNGRHFIQATAAKKPLYKTAVKNGLPGIRADGVDDWMQCNIAAPASGPLTVFIIYAVTTAATAGQSAIRGSGWLMGNYGATAGRFFSGGFIGSDFPTADNVFNRHTSTMTDAAGTVAKHYVGNTQNGATGVPGSWPGSGSAKFALFANESGGGEFLGGWILEAFATLEYDPSWLANANAYAVAKWGA